MRANMLERMRMPLTRRKPSFDNTPLSAQESPEKLMKLDKRLFENVFETQEKLGTAMA